MKPMLKALVIKRLKLKFDEVLSSSAFIFNLRCYRKVPRASTRLYPLVSTAPGAEARACDGDKGASVVGGAGAGVSKGRKAAVWAKLMGLEAPAERAESDSSDDSGDSDGLDECMRFFSEGELPAEQ